MGAGKGKSRRANARVATLQPGSFQPTRIKAEDLASALHGKVGKDTVRSYEWGDTLEMLRNTLRVRDGLDISEVELKKFIANQGLKSRPAWKGPVTRIARKPLTRAEKEEEKMMRKRHAREIREGVSTEEANANLQTGLARFAQWEGIVFSSESIFADPQFAEKLSQQITESQAFNGEAVREKRVEKILADCARWVGYHVLRSKENAPTADLFVFPDADKEYENNTVITTIEDLSDEELAALKPEHVQAKSGKGKKITFHLCSHSISKKPGEAWGAKDLNEAVQDALEAMDRHGSITTLNNFPSYYPSAMRQGVVEDAHRYALLGLPSDEIFDYLNRPFRLNDFEKVQTNRVSLPIYLNGHSTPDLRLVIVKEPKKIELVNVDPNACSPYALISVPPMEEERRVDI